MSAFTYEKIELLKELSLRNSRRNRSVARLADRSEILPYPALIQVLPSCLWLGRGIPTRTGGAKQSLHDLFMAHSLVGAPDSAEEPPADAQGTGCRWPDANDHEHLRVVLNSGDGGLQARVGGVLDSIGPILQCLLANGNPADCSRGLYADEERAACGVCEGANRLKRLVIERGLELDNLRFALREEVRKVHDASLSASKSGMALAFGIQGFQNTAALEVALPPASNGM